MTPLASAFIGALIDLSPQRRSTSQAVLFRLIPLAESAATSTCRARRRRTSQAATRDRPPVNCAPERLPPVKSASIAAHRPVPPANKCFPLHRRASRGHGGPLSLIVLLGSRGSPSWRRRRGRARWALRARILRDPNGKNIGVPSFATGDPPKTGSSVPSFATLGRFREPSIATGCAVVCDTGGRRLRQANRFQTAGLRAAASQARTSRSLSPLHEQAGLGRSGQVASEGGHAPFARHAGLAAEPSVAGLFNEAEADQLLEASAGGVPGNVAFARGVANGEGDLAVVRASVSSADLKIDGARVGGQRAPRARSSACKSASESSGPGALCFSCASRLRKAICRDRTQLRVETDGDIATRS